MSKKLGDFWKNFGIIRITELSRSWKAGRSHTRPYLTNWRSASSKRRSQQSEAVPLFSWKHRWFLELWFAREIDYQKFRFCRHCPRCPWTFLWSSKWSSSKNQAHKVFFKMATKFHSFLKQMPCTSTGPKWFWTVQIILVEYQLFWTGPICFCWVKIL